MKRLIFAGLLAVLVAACQPTERDATPTLDTEASGAPLNPGGVGPSESQAPIESP